MQTGLTFVPGHVGTEPVSVASSCSGLPLGRWVPPGGVTAAAGLGARGAGSGRAGFPHPRRRRPHLPPPLRARAWVRPSVCSLDVSGNFQPGSERVSERGRERSTEARRAGQEEEVSPPERPGCALTASRALRAPGLPPPPPSASACSRAGSSSAGRSSGPRRARPASRFSARAAAMARR